MENLSSEMEWSEEQITRLIGLYRDRPVLWNQTLSVYKDKHLKNYAWNEISRDLKLSKAEVQGKMRILITQFNRELKKKSKSGSGAEEAKIKWRFYFSFLFLKDKTIPRKTRKTEGEQEISQENSPGDIDDNEQAEEITPATNQPQPTLPSAGNSRSFTPPASISSRSTKRKLNPHAVEAYNVMKRLQSNIKEKDEYDVFGEHVACQIRKLCTEKNKALAKHRISRVLFELEMLEIDEKNTNVNAAPNSRSSGAFSVLLIPESREDN